MPTPPPMSCQRLLSRLLACARRGYHAVGTLRVRPSANSTWRTESLTLTFTARAPCGSDTEILIPAPDEHNSMLCHQALNATELRCLEAAGVLKAYGL